MVSPCYVSTHWQKQCIRTPPTSIACGSTAVPGSSTHLCPHPKVAIIGWPHHRVHVLLWCTACCSKAAVVSAGARCDGVTAWGSHACSAHEAHTSKAFYATHAYMSRRWQQEQLLTLQQTLYCKGRNSLQLLGYTQSLSATWIDMNSCCSRTALCLLTHSEQHQWTCPGRLPWQTGAAAGRRCQQSPL